MYKEDNPNSRTAIVNMTGEVSVNKTEDPGSDYGDVVRDAEANPSKDYGESSNLSNDDSLEKKNDANQDEYLKDSAIFSLGYVGIPIQGFVNQFMAFGLGLLFTYIFGPYGRDLPTAQLQAATSLGTVFHSFSILFGIWVDTFPIMGLSWKPYLILGWLAYLSFLLPVTIIGDDIGTDTLIILIAMSQFGIQLSTTAVDGFLPWITSKEAPEKKGRFQVLRDLFGTLGIVCAIIFMFFAFSGPRYNCPGYETDPTEPCSTDETVLARNALSGDNPDDWCYMICPEAIFDFDFGVRAVYSVIIGIILLALPFCFFLHEEKKVKKNLKKRLGKMWRALTNRAVWQLALYSLCLGTLIHVENFAYFIFSATLISQRTLLPLVSTMLGVLMVMVTLGVVAKYALGFSWHKIMLIGTLLDVFIELLRFLFVFDVTRNPVLWIICTTPAGFLQVLTSLPLMWAVNIVADEGLEAATVALIGTTNVLAVFLSRIAISVPLQSFFPLLSDTARIIEDTHEVHMEFVKYDSIALLLKISTIFLLPMLPRQREEAKALKDRNERSHWWAGFTIGSITVLLLFGACAAVLPYVFPGTRCLKSLGGLGCSEDSGNAVVIVQIVFMLCFCFTIPMVVIYLPILLGKEKFSWDMYL